MNEKTKPVGVCTDMDVRQRALANATSSIRSAQYFPRNVFSVDCNTFLFFDSDRMFDALFAEQVRTLLQLEGGTCACMINLDQAASGIDNDWNSYCLFIDKTMTNDAYQSRLCGANIAEGWIYAVDRFGCSSDVGEWCIYCEKRSEMAAFALRKQDLLAKYESVMNRLEALPINEAIAKPLSYGFDPRHLKAEWQEELTKEYRSRD